MARSFNPVRLLDGSNDPLPSWWAAVLVLIVAAGGTLGLATLRWPGLAAIAAIHIVGVAYGIRIANWPPACGHSVSPSARGRDAVS